MPATKIGSDLCKRRNISLDDTDWESLINKATDLNLASVSSLIRLFLRSLQEEEKEIKPILKRVQKRNNKINNSKTSTDKIMGDFFKDGKSNSN